MSTVSVILYVCPTPECGNYYGSSHMPDLHNAFTGPAVEDRAELERKTGSPWRHARSQCPDCRRRGEQVERQPVMVNVSAPAETREALALPSC